MKFSGESAQKLGWKGLDFWVYNNAQDFGNASAAYFEVTGSHGRVKTTKSDRVYYVIDGQGTFEINGKKESVHARDVVIIPKNTPYDYWAENETTLKMFLVHTPAFDPASEVRLDSTKRTDI